MATPSTEIHPALPAPGGPGSIPPPEPFSSLVRVDLGAVTHAGLVRPNNEDHYLVAKVGRSFECLLTNLPENRVPERFDEVGYVYAVADGMGGHASGEVASRTALLAGIRLVLNDVRWSLKIDENEARELMERMGGFIRQIHETVSARAQSDPRLYGMGTTLTVAYSVGPDLFVVHVGDSRAYLCRQGRLRLLTRDHTVAQKLADANLIAPEDIAQHRMRHVLTNVIGGPNQRPVHAELHRTRLADGDQLLLCSDGLTDLVPDNEVAEVLARSASADQKCQALRDAALARGGRDNVTAVLARYAIPLKPG